MKRQAILWMVGIAGALLWPLGARADAPAWMHALVGAPVPTHDEKTDAVLMYAEEIYNVQPNGKTKSTVRRAYKILRPGGKSYGTVRVDFAADTKISSIHGWCIPSSGKDYEVKDKDSMETSLFGVANGELMSDVRTKLLTIPAADVGNIVGYEVEREARPFLLEDEWSFQHSVPTAQARYTLQLPPGWEYKATWLNYEEVKPTPSGNNQWQWTLNNIAAVKPEDSMPPWSAVAGVMMITFLQPGGTTAKGFQSWKEAGIWEAGLEQGRRDASPEIKQKVVALTSANTTQLAKMQSIAKFVQTDIRYVAIELGIGGVQPHYAADIFTHRYGDCKDKATLASSMLHEIGVDSYYISINTTRGGATPERPAMGGWFNHEILAVKLPADMKDPSLVSVYDHPKLGRILIFDPTDEYTPFGKLRGELQANYGLLVAPDGGDLIKLPQLAPEMSGLKRTGKLTLTANGALSGDIVEELNGDSAWRQRILLKNAAKSQDQVKHLESLISHSIPSFRITKASVLNLNMLEQPFGYRYSLEADSYAKTAGNLLLVRPRVLGIEWLDLLETKEARKYPVEFEGPARDVDVFEINLPAGYEVDDMPPPVDLDYSFASYHSKVEVNGNTLKYTRTFEVKELSVPADKTNDLKKMFRTIAGDERNTAVLKASAKP